MKESTKKKRREKGSMVKKRLRTTGLDHMVVCTIKLLLFNFLGAYVPTMPVLCLYYACTMSTMPVLCLLSLCYAYYACTMSTILTMPTMLVLCLHCVYYAYYACTCIICLLCLFITTDTLLLEQDVATVKDGLNISSERFSKSFVILSTKLHHIVLFEKLHSEIQIKSSHIMHINSFYSMRPTSTSIKIKSNELLFIYDKL